VHPFTDDVSALLAISWPFLREAVAGHVVAFEAKRVPDNLGGAVAVVAVDCLLKKVRHGYASSLSIRARRFLPQSSSASRVTAGGLEFGNGPLALGRFLARNVDQRFAIEHHLVIEQMHDSRARDFSAMSSCTVTVTKTVSPIFTGARKLRVCEM
jgi:hypothetical protein